MAFSNGSYGKIWSFEDKGKYGTVNLSTSKKNKDTDQYETDFQHKFVTVAGEAYSFLKSNGVPKDGLRVKIVSCAVTNKYDPDKKVTYWNPVVFALEDANGGSAPATKSGNKKAAAPAKKPTGKTDYAVQEDDDEAQLPF